MKRVLVTGANSMLGTYLVKALLEKGYEVRAMVREIQSMKVSPHPRLGVIQADLRDEKRLYTVVKDLDTVIHNAAFTSQNEPSYQKYHQVNVLGTEKLLKAAVETSVKRFILISSATTYYSKQSLKNEVQCMVEKTYYSRSKLQAEQKMKKIGTSLRVNSIHPTFMIGKYDGKPSSGKIIQWMRGKKIVFYPPGGKNFVSASKVSQSTLGILEEGVPGKAYLISGVNLTYQQFFKLCLQVNCQNSLLVKIPLFLLKIMGWIGDLMRFLQIKTSWSSLHMRILATKTYYPPRLPSFSEGKFTRPPLSKIIKQAIVWQKKTYS